MDKIDIGIFNHEFHTKEHFREQLAVFHVGNVSERDKSVTLVRNYMNVCLPALAGFDPERPGSDTLRGWQIIDTMIEEQGVRGVFHTHPHTFVHFSGHDWISMKAFARAYGSRPLWYGVQAADSQACHFVCLYMKSRKIFCFNCGMIESKPDDLTITVPLPPSIKAKQDMLVMEI